MKSSLVSTSTHRLRPEPSCVEESQRWASLQRVEVEMKFHLKLVSVRGEQCAAVHDRRAVLAPWNFQPPIVSVYL